MIVTKLRRISVTQAQGRSIAIACKEGAPSYRPIQWIGTSYHSLSSAGFITIVC